MRQLLRKLAVGGVFPYPEAARAGVPMALGTDGAGSNNSLDLLADLKVFVQVRSLMKGQLDHIPTTYVAELAPNLAKHCERIAADPRVVAYYAARS